VYVLLAQDMLQILPSRDQRFRKARLQVPGIQREVECRNASVSQAISKVGLEQASVGRDVNPEALLGRVVDNLVHEVRPEKRLASHQCQHPAAMVVEPVDGTPRDILGHALDGIVVRPAVPAIEIALVLDE